MPRPRKSNEPKNNRGIDLHANSLATISNAKSALKKAKELEQEIENSAKYIVVPTYYPDKKMTVMKKIKIFEDDELS